MIATHDEISEWWDRNPCNARHSSARIGSLQHHLEITKKKFRAEPHLPPFADFNAWFGKRVLDAGCGIGTVAIEYVKAGADVTGVDSSWASIQIAARRARSMCDEVFNRTGLVVGNIESPPPRGMLFDLVWCWGVLHHTPDPKRALECFRRALVPGGVLKVMVYHRYSTKAAALWLKHWREGLDGALRHGAEANDGCPLVRTYSVPEARRLVEGAGFKITSCHVDHIFKWSVPHYIRGEWVEKPWVQAMPKDAFRWLEKHFGWHILIEARA